MTQSTSVHVTEYPPAAESWRGVAILVHGLNANPTMMEPLARELAQRGIGSFVVALTGHGDNPSQDSRQRLVALSHVTANVWRQDVAGVWALARQEQREKEVPLFFVGHSMGGLLGVDLLNRLGAASGISKMVLLAPAVTPRWFARLVRVVRWWPTWVVPSAAPRETRSNAGVPVAAYLALMDLVRGLDPVRRDNVNIPTLLFIDEADELVDPDGLRSFVWSHGLHRWRGLSVTKSPDAPLGFFHHMITGARQVGKVPWDSMVQRIASHFLGE